QKLYYESWKNQFTSFKNNIDTQITTHSSRYDDAKNIFNGAHSISLPSGSSSGCSSFVFHGRTIDLIICERLQIFSPIIYFVITLLSMIAVFKFSVNQLLRGLE
ncbi:MAG: hypothetical protein RBT59_09900, partial [Arcobacteraceae bacterium]|nr:hypothetical protein [Arcobacteraceae bacterium]